MYVHWCAVQSVRIVERQADDASLGTVNETLANCDERLNASLTLYPISTHWLESGCEQNTPKKGEQSIDRQDPG